MSAQSSPRLSPPTCLVVVHSEHIELGHSRFCPIGPSLGPNQPWLFGSPITDR